MSKKHAASSFELSNDQRRYLGLDPIQSYWDRVNLPENTYRPKSTLYFEGETIKRHIVSTEVDYEETQYSEPTRRREYLLPKTKRGKEVKLTVATLERLNGIGVHVFVGKELTIGNYTAQRTFYSSYWDHDRNRDLSVAERIHEFVKESPPNHFEEIEVFKHLKRKHQQFKVGDYFCFKLSRTQYGFGRVLLNIHELFRSNIIDRKHGFGKYMGHAIVVQLFAYKSDSKQVDIQILDQCATIPVDLMMDNHLLYGDYEIIGHRQIQDDEYDFPISFGCSFRGLKTPNTIELQWGLIQLEIPLSRLPGHLAGSASFKRPFAHGGIGFDPPYCHRAIQKALANEGIFNFDSGYYDEKGDLRNPINKGIRHDVLSLFGLDPTKSYIENCKLTKTLLPSQIKLRRK